MAFSKGWDFDPRKKQEIIQRRIDAQEARDFYVVNEMFRENFSTLEDITDVKLTQTERFCHYDVILTFKYKGKPQKWAIEIKERHKDWEQALDNPNAELKLVKYNYIKKATHNFEDFDRVYYCQLLNETRAYFFDLKNIDIRDIKCPMLQQRITHCDFNSAKVWIPTYMFPYSSGLLITGINKYFTDYAHYLQTCKEER